MAIGVNAYDLFIFDLDGTLVDSQQDLTAAANQVRIGQKLPALTLSTIRSFVGNGVRILIERTLPGAAAKTVDEAVRRFKTYYADHLLDNTTLYPGIEKVIKGLKGARLAVLTNKPEQFARNILRGLSIDSYFSVVYGGDTGPKRKPDPAPLIAILNALNVRSESAIMIGDGINDILAAKAAGIPCAAVGYGYTEKEELVKHRPDYFFDAPEDILSLIE